MGIRTAIANFFDPPAARAARTQFESRSAVATVVTPSLAGRARWPDRNVALYGEDGYRKLALIFRCVGITANAIAAAHLLVKEDLDGKEETIRDHPMRQLVVRPNPQMRERRFLSIVGMLTAVAGFCVVEKVRSPAGRVVELWPLRPDWCKYVPRQNAAPDWEYRVPGYVEPFRLKADDVLHFTYADRPDLSPYGAGALEAALRELGLLNTMTDFLKAFFDGGAMPVYGLVPDLQLGERMTQADVDLVREKWTRRHAGLANAIEPAILQSIKDVKRLSFDFDELAFTDLRDISELAICQAFGIPPGLVGVRFGLERNTMANNAEQRRSFYEDTIQPLWDRFDDILTLGLLPEFDQRPNVLLDFDTSDIPALQEDRNARATWVVQATLGGALSVHTLHQELGLAVPKGEDFFLRGIAQEAIPASDPLGLQAATEAQAKADAIAAGQGNQTPPIDDPDQVPQDPTADDEQRAWHVLREQRGRVRPSERRAAVGVVARRRIRKAGDKATPWMRDFFAAQGRRVLSAATRAGATDHERRQLSDINWQREEEELRKVLAKVFQLTGDLATEAINEELGTSLSFDLANPKLGQVRQLLGEHVKSITSESRGTIQEIVTKAGQDGKTIEQLAADLEATFSDWSASRAATVARTESMHSYGYASAAQYRESGVVDRVQCFDNPDHADDYGAEDGLSCADRNGLIAPLEDAELHIRSEHPNGTLAIAGVLAGEE